MIYSVSLVFILIIFLFIGMTFGFNRAVAFIPVLFYHFFTCCISWMVCNKFFLANTSCNADKLY